MRRLPITVATVLALGVLAGCGADSESGSDSAAAVGSVAAARGDPGAGPAAVPDEAAPDRQVVQTAHASVAVEDTAVAAQRVSELVEAAGGRVDERTEQAAST